MAHCPHPEKQHHKTLRAAQDQLSEARRASNHTGGGHSLNALGIYRCPCGEGWCVGRAKNRKTVLHKVTAEPKPKSMSEIRRRVKKIGEQIDRYNKHRFYLAGKLIEADRAKLAAVEERQQLTEEMQAEQKRVLAELGIR